ncbi:AraC family transcriptional regulator N-terminal domain-containing protein [Thiofilum flexile]|uniref:AraC family transcriptional regulator N-terminal domain-containing protein n=1 Tax=Thiofilum flexile TaxID=125627 RepID=UPI003CCBCE93
MNGCWVNGGSTDIIAFRGISVSPLTMPLLKLVQRLFDLLDTPEDIPILAPLLPPKRVGLSPLSGGSGLAFKADYCR